MELEKLGLSQRRKNKYILVLNRILKMGFSENTQRNVDEYFTYLKNSEFTYETKKSYWYIFCRYMKWLNPELKFNYKLQTTVKRRLPTVLTVEEVVRMINHTNNPRDRAILSLLFDTGMRPSELLNLKVEDVIFDEQGMIVNIDGKTGMRKIMVVNTVHSQESVKEWLKYHEFKENPYSPLFYNMDKKIQETITVERLNIIVKELGKKIGKNVKTYSVRHSSATYLSQLLTEQQLKIYFGWTMGSSMVQTYVHLSCKDLSKSVIELNKKPVEKKEELKELKSS
jgi:integrase